MSACAGRWFVHEPAVDCSEAPVVCSECVRAIALKWWGGITRHSHGGYAPHTCVLCEIGAAELCPRHFLAAVMSQRGALREQGARIGEPERGVLL